MSDSPVVNRHDSTSIRDSTISPSRLNQVLSRALPARRLATICVLLLGALAVAPALAKPTRSITEKDIFGFTWIADPQISPDGAQLVFVKVTASEKNDNYESSLWKVPAAGGVEPERLTNGPNDTAPRWSPDGRQLAFVRGLKKDGKPQPSQIFVLSFSGGEPRALTSLPKGAASPAWSPDGSKIAFLSNSSAGDLKKSAMHSAGEETPAKGTVRKSDVRIITRAVYRFNGSGYLDPARPRHIWVMATALKDGGDSSPPVQLTSGAYSEEDPAWSPDGARIYFLSTRVVEDYYELPHKEIYAVPSSGGETAKIAQIKGSISEMAVSRDGARIAFTGVLNQPVRSYDQPDLFVAEARSGGVVKNLTRDYDFDVASGLTGDQRAPRGGASLPPVWSGDGRSIVVATSRQGRQNLERFNADTGEVSEVTTGAHEVMACTATPGAAKIVVLVSTPTNVGDLFAVDAGGGLRPLTHVNQKLFSELNLTEPEEFWYPSFDGAKIQAWIQKPPGYNPKKKYPLILNIHGGPHGAYGYTFDHEFQWMAAQGYLVLYPNPRGSTSYGQDFGNVIQYHYPGDDYKDLMAGVDVLVARGMADPKKLGVTGGSGGGLLTNWTITQTDRFAAAVSQRDIADWSAWWYTADFTLFQATWFKAAPWQDPADYAARSPITQIEKVKTPLMLILGEADYRTPPASGGEQMFRALKFLHKPVVMVRFPGESHELSRSGKPWHRVERLQNIVNWFDIYLRGKSIPGYDPLVPAEAPDPDEQP